MAAMALSVPTMSVPAVPAVSVSVSGLKTRPVLLHRANINRLMCRFAPLTRRTAELDPVFDRPAGATARTP
ncbi:hypothetical protein GCM10010145_06780 [Streptomyces ruber]|uniref:Uncharacterized protein n=2 Tax=Streptomyces TaxID=1883 RepID=A0A918B7X0_9ACTN|nr:hypothetical protein GCM10010145_06780 [Streptomyces ruber]